MPSKFTYSSSSRVLVRSSSSLSSLLPFISLLFNVLVVGINCFQFSSVHKNNNNNNMPPNQGLLRDLLPPLDGGASEHSYDDLAVIQSPVEQRRIRCAILGCGMMGQEHISYITGYPQCRIDYLCDPHEPSLQNSLEVLQKFQKVNHHNKEYDDDDDDEHHYLPVLLQDEDELLNMHAHDIDLLVVASPNYLHAETIQRWGQYQHLTILCEKPIAVSQQQHDDLLYYSKSPEFQARVWVAMEYRFIPAIAKLLSLIPSVVGEIKMVTIRENRYPFLDKIGNWNRNRAMTGDTLVEKCCHFFDLFRLITGQEAVLPQVKALAQRGINYHDEAIRYQIPIIDAAYIFMPFCNSVEQEQNLEDTDADSTDSSPSSSSSSSSSSTSITKDGNIDDVVAVPTMACLELCMYAEGSRHQEEIIVTGTKGRLEAYLPENKVYAYQRPSQEEWSDRSVPPPKSVIREVIYDCSDVRNVHGIENEIPVHGGYHYSSTAVEWYQLLSAMNSYNATCVWQPGVSFTDGLKAVEIGLLATRAIVNEQDGRNKD